MWARSCVSAAAEHPGRQPSHQIVVTDGRAVKTHSIKSEGAAPRGNLRLTLGWGSVNMPDILMQVQGQGMGDSHGFLKSRAWRLICMGTFGEDSNEHGDFGGGG
jgi:hypothetical protein